VPWTTAANATSACYWRLSYSSPCYRCLSLVMCPFLMPQQNPSSLAMRVEERRVWGQNAPFRQASFGCAFCGRWSRHQILVCLRFDNVSCCRTSIRAWSSCQTSHRPTPYLFLLNSASTVRCPSPLPLRLLFEAPAATSGGQDRRTWRGWGCSNVLRAGGREVSVD